MSELIHSMFRPMVAPQPPANTNTNTNNQGANLRGVPSTNNYQAPALRVQRQQVQQRQQVAPVAPVGRICCDHQAALNYFVTRHYNTKRASYDQLCFIVDANGTQRLWKKMSISEMCYVVHTQFNKGDTGEIWKCLNTLKKKGWANAKARRNLRTAVETYLGLEAGTYSWTHGPKHAIRAMIATQWLAKELGTKLGATPNDRLIAGYAAIGHDSGRQSENEDVYEEVSAWNMRNYLSNNANIQKHAKAVYDAMIAKDSKKPGKTKAAILLQCADCLEITRCQNFDLKNFDVKNLDIVRLKIVTSAEAQKLAAKWQKFINNTGKGDKEDAYTNHYLTKGYKVNLKEYITEANSCGISW